MTKRRYDAAAQTKPETPIARHEINTPRVILLLLLLLSPPPRRLALFSALLFSLVSTPLGNGNRSTSRNPSFQNEEDVLLLLLSVDDFDDDGGGLCGGVLGYFPRRVSRVVVVVLLLLSVFFSAEGREGSVKVVLVLSTEMRRLMCVKEGEKRTQKKRGRFFLS